MTTNKDNESLKLWKSMFGDAKEVRFGNYVVTYKRFMELINSHVEEKVLEARIDQAKETRGTMYINAPNVGYAKFGINIQLLEDQLKSKGSE